MNADLTLMLGLYPNSDASLKPDARIVFQLKHKLHQAGDAKVTFTTKRDSRVNHQNVDQSSFAFQLCHAPLPIICWSEEAMRVGDAYTQGEYLTYAL